FQCLGRYPASARTFDDPILFLAGLQSSWNMANIDLQSLWVARMSFRNFIYIEDDKDLTFLPKDFSLGFNTGSLSVSINTNPVRTDEEHAVEPATELVNERVGTTADSGGRPKGNTFVVHAGSVVALIRERKFKTRGGSLRPLVKRNLASGSSTSCIVRAKASGNEDDTPELYHFLLMRRAKERKIYSSGINNHLDMDLLDIHDRCYARQAIMDNVVNRRSRELLKVIEKLRGLWAKCEAAMIDFDKNPAILLLQEKILSALESKVASLEAEKANLVATEASLCQEIEEVKHDRREVVSKVVPYACMLGGIILRMRRSTLKPTRTLPLPHFPGLNEYVADSSASMEALLSKKPPNLQKPIPSRTQMPVRSSQLATPSSAPSSKPMFPPAGIVKPSPSLNE
ncbi:hypothetical protein Tco_0413863, partial [Tanacetum coccineum]